MTQISDSDVMQRLKEIARNHRWAFEELVLDQKMVEANDLCNGDATGMLRFLLTKLRTKQAVLAHLHLLVVEQRRPLKSLALDKNDSLRNQGRHRGRRA